MASVRRRGTFEHSHAQRGGHAHKRAATAHARSSSSSSTSPDRRGRGPNAPLRRGDACLMCRAKKLKCSASKPTCDQCSKRKDRCVYDPVRPTSRVERLTRELAQREEQEMRAVSGRWHPSAAAMGITASPFTMQPQSYASSPPLQQPIPQEGPHNPFDYGSVPFQPPPYFSHRPPPPLPLNLSAAHQPLSQNSVDPTTGWLWNSGSGQTQTPLFATEPADPTPIGPMPWTLLSATNDVSVSSSFWSGANLTPDGEGDKVSSATASQTTFTPKYNAVDLNATLLGSSYVTQMPTSARPKTTESAVSAEISTPPHPSSGPFGPVPDFSLGTTTKQDSTDASYFPHYLGGSASDSVPSHGLSSGLDLGRMELGAYLQFEEKEISQSARDYLVNLFFSSGKIGEQQERALRRRFTGHGDRPHHCLLFSMYLVGASSSFIPAVRRMADPLFFIASMKVDEAVAQEDRLLDAIEAMRYLGTWLYGRSRMLEGYQMLSRACSLAVACGLHRSPGTTGDEKRGSSLLGPPSDLEELQDRIHTFWNLWIAQRSHGLMIDWPSPLRDEVITTPLPRTLAEGNARPSESDVFTLADVYSLCHGDHVRPPSSPTGQLIVALHLLHRARHLQDQPVEGTSLFTPVPPATSLRNSRFDHPRAYQDILDAVLTLERSMPERAGGRVFDPSSTADTDALSISLCLGAARMVLHEPEVDEHNREMCLLAARSLATVIKSYDLSQQQGPRRALGGFHAIWYWTADRLVRCARLLRAQGQEQEGTRVMSEAKEVLGAIKALNMACPLSKELDRLQQAVQGKEW